MLVALTCTIAGTLAGFMIGKFVNREVEMSLRSENKELRGCICTLLVEKVQGGDRDGDIARPSDPYLIRFEENGKDGVRIVPDMANKS